VNNSSGGTTEEVDLQDTRTTGLETTWSFKVDDYFSIGGTVTYQDHEITKSEANPDFVGNELRRQPNFIGALTLDYDNSSFDANFVYNYTGSKFSNESNSIELDAIGIANLNLGYTFALGEEGNETLRLGSQVFNLFNSAGITEGSPRLNNNQTEEEFFVGRPVLPTRLFFNATFSF
jgi:outer membrane cobalamin receptor